MNRISTNSAELSDINSEVAKGKKDQHNPNYAKVREVLISRTGDGSTGEPALLRVYSDVFSRRGEAEPAWFVTIVQGAKESNDYHRETDPVYLGDVDATLLANELMKLQAELQEKISAYKTQTERAAREKEEKARQVKAASFGMAPFRLI